MVRLVGTVAEPVLVDKFTLTPRKGAAAVNVTVPVVLLPPVIVEGDTDTLPRIARVLVGGLTVREVVTELDEAAVMVTLWTPVTVLVVTGKVAEVWPAATSSCAGT